MLRTVDAIELLSRSDRAHMVRAGAVAAQTLQTVAKKLRPGISTADLDRWVRLDTVARRARPSQLGYQGFPAAVCTSRNEVVCHGIPNEDEILQDGDIINIDVTSEVDGFHGDTSDTFAVGEASEEAQHLIQTTRHARDSAIALVRPGVRSGDIGACIMEIAQAAGLSVVKEFGGHGIGRRMHQAPHVSHVGQRGRGLRLRPGMAFTIEPMLNLGGPEVEVCSDGWRVVTKDGRWSAQAEHTLLVTEDGAVVTTQAGFDARFLWQRF